MLNQKITELHSSSAFVKIKNDYFDIGQVLFSFVKTKDGKAISSIDCCLPFQEALGLAFQITTGRVSACMGNEYAWKSGIGGVHEEDAKRRGLRDDGMAVARWFGIQSANAGWARFTASQVGGRTDRQGLIVPAKEKPVVITVPIPSESELINMMLEMVADIVAYKSSRYTLEWDKMQEEARNARSLAKENASGENAGSGVGTPKEVAALPEKVVCDGYYCINKGSVMERRGKDNDATVLRMVVPKISDNEPAVLESDARWQLADVVFYEKAVAKASDELAERIREVLTKVEAEYTESLSIKGMTLKVGDVRDGYRQLVFTNK